MAWRDLARKPPSEGTVSVFLHGSLHRRLNPLSSAPAPPPPAPHRTRTKRTSSKPYQRMHVLFTLTCTDMYYRSLRLFEPRFVRYPLDFYSCPPSSRLPLAPASATPRPPPPPPAPALRYLFY